MCCYDFHLCLKQATLSAALSKRSKKFWCLLTDVNTNAQQGGSTRTIQNIALNVFFFFFFFYNQCFFLSLVDFKYTIRKWVLGN